MKLISIIISLFFVSSVGFSDSCKKSLVHFTSKGREVSSQLIGNDDLCDGFGGNMVYTPKSHVYLFVNYNIPGSIDLDALDGSLEKAKPEFVEYLRSVDLAVVTQEWMKRVKGDDFDAVLNVAGNIFFISERVLREGNFQKIMDEFYQTL